MANLSLGAKAQVFSNRMQNGVGGRSVCMMTHTGVQVHTGGEGWIPVNRPWSMQGRGGGGCGQGGSNPIAKNGGKIAENCGKIAENCGEIAGKWGCCNQTKLNLPKPQGATILHRSLRMLKQIKSSTGIRITMTSGPQYHYEIEA